mmetsp:Transcript_28887/g.42949  ORF Transcript_28887/g.42949 Transcript_28887/m.42949 type:complete len:88 (-) Transcript_28887:136-399(-)
MAKIQTFSKRTEYSSKIIRKHKKKFRRMWHTSSLENALEIPSNNPISRDVEVATLVFVDGTNVNALLRVAHDKITTMSERMVFMMVC